MNYRRFGRADISVSVLGLGGHEFLPNGASRGFHEDFAKAVTPETFFDGFGTEKRISVIRAAYDAGINLFDATIDSEKAALGKNLNATPLPYHFLVQTRPEGMAYNYDLHNRNMADYKLLRAEVLRILALLGKTSIDFFNFPFMASAIENDPDYLAKTSRNIAALKSEGLIRYAGADTFSGEQTYLRQISTDSFDSIFINLNFADDAACSRVLPAAAERGMAVFAREAFMKGALFHMGEEAGITDRDSLAQVAVNWLLAHSQVTSVVVGIDTPSQLACQLNAIKNPELIVNDAEILRKLKSTNSFRELNAQKSAHFLMSHSL